MKTAIVALGLVGCLFANAQAWALNLDEVSAGAAATIVLGRKCAPSQAAAFESAVRERLRQLVARLSPSGLAYAQDAMELKTKAFTISSRDSGCANSDRLYSMAVTWGFSDFFEK